MTGASPPIAATVSSSVGQPTGSTATIRSTRSGTDCATAKPLAPPAEWTSSVADPTASSNDSRAPTSRLDAKRLAPPCPLPPPPPPPPPPPLPAPPPEAVLFVRLPSLEPRPPRCPPPDPFPPPPPPVLTYAGKEATSWSTWSTGYRTSSYGSPTSGPNPHVGHARSSDQRDSDGGSSSWNAAVSRPPDPTFRGG